MRTTKAPCHLMGTAAAASKIKQPEHEANHSTPSTPPRYEENAWSYTYNPTYVSKA
jgi:hypothetical protein